MCARAPSGSPQAAAPRRVLGHEATRPSPTRAMYASMVATRIPDFVGFLENQEHHREVRWS